MNFIFKHIGLPFKRSFDLLIYSAAILFLFTSCGEVISSKDYSTVVTAEIGWKNISNINTLNINLFPLTGTCTTEAGDVSIQIGNPPMASQILPCVGGKFKITMDLSGVGLPEGNIDLIATQTVISADATTSLIVDTIVPLAPVIISPAAASILGSTVQVIDGTCEDGARINISGDVRGNNLTTTCIGGTFTSPISITNGDGPKTIVVTQTDPAGNTSPSSSVAITLDTAGTLLPAAPVITSPTTGSLTTSASQTVVGTCEDGASLNITGSVVGSPISLACVGGTYSQPITLSAGDGVKTINITQTNVAGTSPTTSVIITLDTTAPSAPVITSPTTGSNTNTVSQTIVGTCETGATVSITGNVIGAPVNAICVGGTYSEPITVTAGDGPKNITVDQTDPAGNVSPSTNITINLDTLAPAAPTITSPTTGSITNLVSQTIVGTCESGATVRITGNLVGAPVVVVCVAGNYSQPITLTAGDGTKNIIVGQTDTSGNASPTTNINVILDSTAPLAPTVTSPTNGSTSNLTSQTVAGTCETGTTVNISGAIVGSPVTTSCVAGSYTQPVTLTPGDGVKAIGVTQTDAANNTSPATNISITLDASAPSAPTITAPTNGTTVNTVSQTVVGACETGATVNISGAIVGSPVTATCVASSYSRAITLTAADGVKAISATQTDAGLNTSPATNISITLDSTAPSAPTITSPANSSYVNVTAQTIVGACETGATVNISGAIVGSPVTATCVASSYSRAITLTAADGVKAISATQTDTGLNTSPATSISITLDSTVPSAPSITAPVNGLNTNSTSQTVVGACETGATVNISGAIVGSPVTATCVASSYSRAVTLTAGDGAKAISATQTDLAGNISVATNISVNLDQTAPAAPTITSPINGSTAGSVAQTITGTCVTGHTVNISGDVVGSPVTTSCVAGNYSQGITISGGDGIKNISVTQTDLAANTSPAANISIDLDTGLPAAPTITSPANSSYVNTTAQTIVGACETGATVNISGAIVGSPVTATCVASSYSRAVTLTAADGVKSISATQTDTGMNTSPATNISITLDTAAPAAPTITSPANSSFVNTTAQTIVGACETGATVNISGAITGSPVTATCVASSYSRAVTLTAADGVKAISATQTDLAGNTSTATNISITLDTGLPLAPTITSPANGSFVNTTAQTIVGACETGATVNISGAIIGSPVTATCVASAYSRAVTLTAADGAKAISATQTDLAGNISAATNISITLDTSVPLAPTITSPANSSYTNTTAQTIVGACETGATVNISGAIVGSPVNATCVASSYSRAVTLTAADGAKAISATQTDLAGNTSAATNISITLDTTAPAAPTITSPANSSYVSTTSQTVIGVCETGATVNITGNVVGSPIAFVCIAGSYNEPISLTAGDGSKTISVAQTDPVGNVSGTTSISITLDTAVPAAPTITSPANSSFVNTTAQTIVGACETGATVNISGAITGSPVTATCVASSYSRAVTLTAADGAKAISATQTDLAGNTSTATNISINLDTAAPSAPTITAPANNAFVNSTSQTIIGACETGATVNISGAIVGSPVTATCVASSYSRAVTLTAADGAKAISATQTDAGMNTSPAANISITLDTGVPAAPTITSPTNGSTANSVAQTIVGTCETGATVNISGDVVGSPVTTSCVAGNYSQGITISGGDGIKNISVTQTDLAANTSTAASISLDLDTGLPAAPTITSPVNSSYVNTTAQTIVGACETGATVNLSGDFTGSPVTASCVASSYSRAITLTAINGVKSISATQTDTGMNTSPATNISITYDNQAPAAPTITSPANSSFVNTTAQTIVGACETGATVNISGAIIGSPVTATCVASAYSRAVTLTAADGAKAISATQTDLAGNTSTATNISITLDTGLPAAPTITSPANSSYVNTTAQTIVGACETGATVNISGAIIGSPVTATCVASSYSRAVTLTAADGAKSISATQTDAAGNTSTATNISITLDTSVPLAPTITSPANSSYVNTTAQTIVGACETGATVNISGAIVGSPVTATCVASAYSRAVTLTAADGAKAISATQTDLAGNTSAATNISITLDSTAPSAPTITSPSDSSYVNTSAQTIIGVCETGATVNITGNVIGSPVAFVCIAGSYNEPVTLTAGDGSKTISVAQTDPVGNVSGTTSISITLDTAVPLAPTITSPANSSYVNTTAQTIVGACETGSTVNISGAITGSPVTATCMASSYSRAVTLTAADGSKAISATQTDLAGNISAATNISITLDTAAPAAPTITSPANGSFVNTTAQTIVGACETGATVNISGAITGSPVTATCVASSYSRAVTLTAADGAKAISATQTDLAGNISAATNISITLDTGAPAAPTITSPTNGSTANSVAQTIVGTCETGATVNISGDVVGSPVTTSCVAGNYSQGVTISGGDGIKNISVTQTDLAANTSTAASISLDLDTGLPAAPTITSPANSSYVNTTAQTIVGACETGATVNISGAITGSPVTATCVAASYSRAVTLTAGDGAKAISATQTDAGMNTSPATNISITLDTSVPLAPTITSPANSSYVNTTAQTIVGACETGSTVNISGAIVGSPVTASCVASSYSRAVTLTAADGAKAISATQTDLAGNISAATNISITLDTGVPAAPTITSPANSSFVNTTAQTIVGACETGATVNISGAITGSPVTASCVASSYSRAVTLTAGDGAKSISATQTDAAGNTSTATNISITLDTAAPIAPTITAPVNGSYTNITGPRTIAGACETGSTVNISGDIIGSPVTAACVASAYSRSITLTSGDGVKALSATQTDLAGNTSAATNISVTLDQTVPAAPTITSPTSGTYTNTASQTIVGACETGTTVRISGGVIGSPVATSCIASSYSVGVTLTAGDGSKSIFATQTDLAGNNSASANISITLDTAVPLAPTITSPANSAYVNTTAQTIVGACETGATVNISGAIVGSPVTATCVASSYSRAVTLTAADGVKAISATQTDLAGNISAATNISITLDTAAPAAPTITSPANSSYTNTTAQTIVGACETGATVNISGAITGSPVTATCVASAYSRAVTLTGGNGAKAISATQTDLAGNISPATNISITLDTGVPAAPTITSPINGSYTNTNSQTVSGACETGATLEIWGNLVGSPLFTVCSASAYSLGVTLTAANGAKTINAHQTDLAGNTSAPVSITITFDSVAPSAPTITSPANGSYTSSTAQTIVGACETGATVNISGAIVGSPVTATCVASSYSRAVTLTAADGAKAISATQTDLAGNTSTATNISINLDTAAPSAPTITAPANNAFVNSTSQTIIGVCETGATVNISGAITGSPVTATCVASAYSRAVTLTTGDGAKAISATQTDLAGNISVATNISITLDTVAPSAPTITAPTNGLLTNTQNQTVTGACETGTTVSVSGDLFGSPVTTTCVAGAYSRTITLTSADGIKAINVTQRDAATNLSPATSISVTLDRTVPNMPTITSPTNGALTNQTSQTVIGACENGATVNISGNIVGSPVTASCLAGNYTRAVTLTAGDGSKSISATQTDGAGNTSSAETISLTLDTTAPSAPTITSPANSSFVNTTAQTIVGACETGATVNISGAITGSPVTATCVASSYSRAVTLTAGDGAKAISATQTDPAGNTSGATNISITLDTAAPSAPTITSPTNGTYTNAPAQTVTGACETGAMVNITGNILSAPVNVLCVASAYSQSVTLTASQGAKTISVNQTDSANNTSSSASVNLTLDTVAPSTPTITSPANNFRTNNTTQTITGACETNATVTITSASLVGPPATGLCTAGAYSISITVTAANGTKSYSVSQADLANNTSGTVSRNIIIDTVAPSAPTVTSHAESEYVNSATLTIFGACETNATVTITGSISGTPSSVCAASYYSINVTLSGVDGAKALNVSQTDVAGNTSATTVRNLNLDTVAPSVVVSSSSGTPTAVSPIPFTITFSEAIQLFDNAVVTVGNGNVTNYTGGPAVYNIEVTPTGPGNVTVQVLASAAQDLAGNDNTVSNIVTINYQTSTLEITSPVDGAVLNPSATVAVSGTCVVGAGNVTITGTAKTGAGVAGACSAGGTFSVNVTTVASGGPFTLIATQAALTDTVTNLWIHCAGSAMRTCALAGSGNSADPYMVGDILCLQEMRVGLTCSYALNNNIDASATSSWNFDSVNFRGWEPVPNTATTTTRFTGRLDGRNRTITDLYITPRFANGTGLFSRIHDEGNALVDEQVFDLTFVTPSVALFTEETFGFLAGTSNLVGIRNVNVINGNGDLTSAFGREFIGLLLGKATASDISDSSVSGSFYLNGSLDEANNKYALIGGLVGQFNDSTATNNLSDFIITSSATNLLYLDHVGGGFGEVNASTISGFKTGFQIDFTHIGVNAFSHGVSKVGGLVGESYAGSSISDVCVNHDMTLKTTNKPMANIGGFAGAVSLGGSDTHVNDVISVKGNLNVDANGFEANGVSGFVGGDLGPSAYSNIVMKSNVTITNSVSGLWRGYGGIMEEVRSSVTLANVLSLSDHDLAAGIAYQSGFASLINGTNVSSSYYANDAFLGGLPAEAAGSGIGITSTTLSTLGGYPNASYTGFDFATVWARDPASYQGVTNLPSLRYCP